MRCSAQPRATSLPESAAEQPTTARFNHRAPRDVVEPATKENPMTASPVFGCSEVSNHRVQRRAGARAILSALVAIGAASLAGCAASDAPDDHPGTGQLVLQLTQPGPHGEIFHLNNAIFDITPATG